MSEPIRVSPAWLDVREAVDAAARSADLVPLVNRRLDAAGRSRLVIHDLGCGTGSMGRWLAPQISGPQHWVMCDRDADLLEYAAADMVDKSADGSPVTVETRQADVTQVTADDLAGVDLVTASALLDLLTVDEVDRIVAACASAGCPALFTLSVAGRVELTPADPLDTEIGAAFNAHQRRPRGDRRLLGPDAVDAAAAAFDRLGIATVVRPSPWRLGPDDAAVMSEWLMGWLSAACLQQPGLAGPAVGWAHRRLSEVAKGRLWVLVHHDDLFARGE
jgi:hypothetical protein